MFTWNADSTRDDDGGTVVQVRGHQSGRWHRVFTGPVRINWFGAKCDDSADDHAAINRAMRAARHVLITGPCRVSRRLELPAGVTLAGAPGSRARLRPAGNFADEQLIVLTHPHVSLRNLELRGDADARTRAGRYDGVSCYTQSASIEACRVHHFRSFGIYVGPGSRHVSIRDCDLFELHGWVGASGVYLRDSHDTEISDVRCWKINEEGRSAGTSVRTNDGNGIYVGIGARKTVLRDIRVRDVGRRAVKIQGADTQLVGLSAKGFGHSAVQVQLLVRDGGAPLTDIHLSKIHAQGGAYGAVFEADIENVTLSGFAFTNQRDTGIDVRNGVANLVVENGVVRDSRRWGVRVERLTTAASATRNITIEGVTTDNCYGPGRGAAIGVREGIGSIDGITIRYCRSINQRGPALQVVGKHRRLRLIDNEFDSSVSIDDRTKALAVPDEEV